MMESENEAKRVALLVTCLVDQVLPEIGVATVRLLRQAGCEVAFPAAQTCCGQPFFNSGFAAEARQLAQRLIPIFEPYEAVVLPSGSCTSMIRVEYPHLLADDPVWHARALALAAKTFELSEYLTTETVWQPSTAATKREVTYHDSCHMCRLLGLKDEPRQLMAAAGHSVREMPESDRCCGFGGLFSLRMPGVSGSITTAKLKEAAGTGADLLVTSDPGCLMQMRKLAGDIEIVHLASLLAGDQDGET